MKKICLFLILATVGLCAFAQTTKRLQNLTDAWGISYSYAGETKNGKPDGMGIAIYSAGNVVRYVGHFVNGVYDGKGTLLFTSGAFLTGQWSNGKLNGRGSNYNSDGSIYFGDFSNGLKDGHGILVYKDNGFMQGGFKVDKLNGRCIYVWGNGSVISDIEYVNDQQNGTGYQYEAESKKIYEGEWGDGKWVQAATASFSSFIQHPDFTGEKNDKDILMGPVNSEGFLKDTAFFYDLPKQKRYFGYFENGKLQNGLQIKDDSTRFAGQIDDIGAKGYCYDFKLNDYYEEGNYTNDHLDGDIVSINLGKKTVYYGKAVEGDFTGKAYFFNDKNEMYAGDYLKGHFTGSGFHLQKSGKCITGTWDDGKVQKVTSVIMPDGAIIPGSPKTFTEALNIVVKDYVGLFDNITGSLDDDADLSDLFGDSSDADTYASLLSFPATSQPDKILDDLDKTIIYIVQFIETKDGNKAKEKYGEIARQLQASVISNKYFSGPVKLQGKVTPVNLADDKNETRFDLAVTNPKYNDFHVWLILNKNKTDSYAVRLEIGEKPEN